MTDNPHATGSRVPNGWGDPSTERHLQVPPRHATPDRAAILRERQRPVAQRIVDAMGLEARSDRVERLMDALELARKCGHAEVLEDAHEMRALQPHASVAQFIRAWSGS